MCNCFENHMKEIKEAENRKACGEPVVLVTYPHITLRDRIYFIPFEIMREDGETEITAFEMWHCPFCGEKLNIQRS